mgnify:CR=1 FL=1
MRQIREPVLAFTFNSSDKHLPKTVREFREKYKRVSEILDAHLEILIAVHEDLRKLSVGGRKGRRGDFSTETILRALVVHAIEGLSLRETVVRIAESEFLQEFVRTRKKAVMDHSFLARCLGAIRPETWKRINQLLVTAAVGSQKATGEAIRADTTVVETNIHWPTDASLLWDTWRVAARLLRRGRALDRKSCPHRFHDKKIRRLYLLITRYARSQSPQRRRAMKAAYRKLIVRTEWIVGIGEQFCRLAAGERDGRLLAVAEKLKGFLPWMQRVVVQARRAQINGEEVPAAERVFSIFEPHTELIIRGRREKPVEFGHKVLLCQTGEKLITDYEVYERQQADCALTAAVIERHQELFGRRPEVLAGDKGFCPNGEQYAELAKQVGTLAIPRRMGDWADKALRAWQAFRAGIEGTISGLKRAFRLARCFYRGFKHFQGAVGLGVFAHNLVVLAQQGMS